MFQGSQLCKIRQLPATFCNIFCSNSFDIFCSLSRKQHKSLLMTCIRRKRLAVMFWFFQPSQLVPFQVNQIAGPVRPSSPHNTAEKSPGHWSQSVCGPTGRPLNQYLMESSLEVLMKRTHTDEPNLPFSSRTATAIDFTEGNSSVCYSLLTYTVWQADFKWPDSALQ